MTEQTPAEAAAAAAPEAHTADEAANPNSDLVGGVDRAPESPQIVPEALPHNPMEIPHGRIVPAAQEHHAGDKPAVHTHVLPSNPEPAKPKVVTPSALLAEKLAALPPGYKPVKKQYAYKRNRK